VTLGGQLGRRAAEIELAVIRVRADGDHVQAVGVFEHGDRLPL